MKEIKIYYPDDMEESEAIEYLPDVFNPKRHDYKSKKAIGKRECTVMVFNNGNIGLFWLTSKGYSLELRYE